MTSCEVSLSSADHFAGDTLRASVTFRGSGDTVEWAAVQIHGHCWHDARLVNSVVHGSQSYQLTPKTLNTRRSSSTSSSAQDRKTAMPDMSSWVEGTTCLFASRPHCLAAELELKGEHTFNVQATLPPVLPPSFRGVSTKYSYLLTVCMKLRREDSARVAHVPFFVAGTPGSMGDAARVGPPSSTFAEHLNGNYGKQANSNNNNAKKKIAAEFSDEEEELIMLQPALLENGIAADADYINAFPQRYEGWDANVCSSNVQDQPERIWFLEKDDAEDDWNDSSHSSHLISPSPRMSDAQPPHGSGTHSFDGPMYHTESLTVRALNAQTGKGRLARVYVHPSIVHPGDAVTIRLDFAQCAERTKSILAVVEVEERTMGPPPLVAVLEPLLRRRQGAGPWVKTLGTKSVDTSMCSNCAFSISTYGAQPDFSTDLIVVHTYLRLEFTTESMVCNLRIPLNVRPPPRMLRVVTSSSTSSSANSLPVSHSSNNLQQGQQGQNNAVTNGNQSGMLFLSRTNSPKSPLSVPPTPGSFNRMEGQSPPPNPSKRLVF